MADVQSNIQVSIDTTQALASIKNLQRQISAFHTSMAKSGAAANAVSAQMQQTLINSINATGQFAASIRTIKTTTESFTSALEKNKFSLGEYFRYAGGASKTFGRLFKTEFDTINKVARENVKDLQTQYIKLGRDASGAMKAIAVRPLSLDMSDLATRTMIASEKQAILNQLLKQGSTNLLNFGKNTQWAGRQLMVGFTLPLVALGSAASKTFMEMETQAIRFKKVYGDLFTPTAESQQALKDIQELGKEFTKYGIAVSETVGLAAEAAAAGFKGVDLQRQTAAATKLSILGQVESQKALETTIALQNAFSMSSANLAESIDFLNAVENQTVLSLDDMSTAIPKAAPVIQQLGGDVKDLAFFMTAMKEGGINASEGANALKSGLASIINPTGKAAAMLESFGINVKKIVIDNKGNLKKTVIDFATALNELDPLNRAQAIEQMFGKFQFARLSTLFANVTKEGTQAARVLDLAGSSVQQLASLSEKELGMTSESAMNKFKAAVENLKLSLVPLGEEFLKAVTPIAEFITKILDKFNNLSDNTKKIIVTITAVVAGLGPVFLMTFGLLANGLANIIKGFTSLKSLFNRTGRSTATLGTEVMYMTTEQRNAAAVAASLDQIHKNLAQTFTSEASAVNALTQAYQRAIAAQSQFVPVVPPLTRGPITKRATGKPAVVGGTGNKDSELSLLMPGETVIPTAMSKKYGGLINAMITDNVPGYKDGKISIYPEYAMRLQPGAENMAQRAGTTGVPEVLSPLALRIGEARGIAPTASQISAGKFDDIYREYERITTDFVERLNTEYNTTFSDIKDDNERMRRSWSAAGKAVEKQIDSIKSDAERGVLRRTFGLDEDIYGTIPTDSREAGGTTPNRARRGAFRSRLAGFRSYTRIRPGAKKLFERMTGRSAADLQMGHVFPPRSIDISELESDPRRASTVATAKAVMERGTKDAKAYEEGKKKGKIKDPYETSTESSRKSPHPKAAKDGRDDARAYADARDKELSRQSGRPRRVATRGQGPAPIGATPQPGATILPIVPGGPGTPSNPNTPPNNQSMTRGQILAARAKGLGGRLTGLGGGMGILGLNMGLSMLPDFAGKNVAQGALTGANLGMMFGGYGMAAGAAIGLVTSAVGALIEKQRQLKAMSEAAFKSSADVATFFGNKVVDTTIKVGSLSYSLLGTKTASDNLGQSFGYTNEELSRFIALVQSLPEDNPLRQLIDGLTNEDNPEKINKIAKAFVRTQVAIGQIKPDQAQKTLDLILSASNHLAMVGSSFMNLQSQTQAISTTLNAAAYSSEILGTSLLELTGAAANSTSLAEMAVIIDGIAASSISAAQAISAMRGAFLAVGNTEGARSLDALQRIPGIQKDQLTYLLVTATRGFREKITKDTDITGIMKRAEEFNKNYFKQISGNSAIQTKAYKDAEAEVAGTKKQIELLKKKKKIIDDQIKKQEKITDEIKRQNDYLDKQRNLDKEIVNAKIRGDYIGAAGMLQEKAQNFAEFKKEEEKAKLQAKSDALQEQIDALQLKNDQVVSAINQGAATQAAATDAAATRIINALPGGGFAYDQPKDQGNQVTTQNAPKVLDTPGGKTVAQTTEDPVTGERKLLKEGVFETRLTRFKNNGRTLKAGDIVQVGPDGDIIAVQTDNPLKPKKSGTIEIVSINKDKGTAQFRVHAASGGSIRGAGTATSDSIPAMLSNGEYVIKADSVKKYGVGTFDALNAQKFKDGGRARLPGSHVSSSNINRTFVTPTQIDEMIAQRGMDLNKFKNNVKDLPLNVTPQLLSRIMGQKAKPGSLTQYQQMAIRAMKGSGRSQDFMLSNLNSATAMRMPNWNLPGKYAQLAGDMAASGRTKDFIREKLGLSASTFVPGKFADGGLASKDGWLQRWAKSISGQPGAEMFGTAPLLRMLAGLGIKKNIIGASQVPLSLAGAGIGQKIFGNLGKAAFYIPNKINQLRNQAKVNAMINSGLWHGSQPTGLHGEDYLQGTNILEGAEAYDPFYGMGFFGTTSKAEAKLYASGLNSFSNWGESFGSLNRIVGAPRGKYVDFTRGSKSLKWQHYGLAKALGVKNNRSMSNFMPENLGDIMSAQGLTGGIMNRINAGRTSEDIQKALWLAWSRPAGVITKEGFSMGGLVPGYADGGLLQGKGLFGDRLGRGLKSKWNNYFAQFGKNKEAVDKAPGTRKYTEGIIRGLFRNIGPAGLLKNIPGFKSIENFGYSAVGKPIEEILAGSGTKGDYAWTALNLIPGGGSAAKTGVQAAAKAPSLAGATSRAITSIPGLGKELLSSGIWNTLGKIKPLQNALHAMIGFAPAGMKGGFQHAFQYASKNGKSFFNDIINRPPPGRAGAGAPSRADDWTGFIPKLRPMEAFGELFGLGSNLFKNKIINPISNKVVSPIKNAYGMSKDKIKQAKTLFTKEGFSDFLYRYTPVGSFKALKMAKESNMVKTVAGMLDGETMSLEQLFQQATYHGGKLPEEILNRLVPGTNKGITGSIFNFDLFTTLDKILAREYAVGKNAEAGGSLWEILWNAPKNMSKVWDMRGGAKSLWSQNKKGYVALEKYFIEVLRMSREEARAMLAGERVPGVARVSSLLQDRIQPFTNMNLNEIFTTMGKNGPEWLIDTIAHTGGSLMGKVPHSVLTTLDPEKMIKSVTNILPKADLAKTLDIYPEMLQSTLESLIQQYIKSGKTFPIIGKGIIETHKKATDLVLANGGLIRGPGTGKSDSIRATLGYAGGGSIRVSNGEYVVKASSVKDYGVAAMNAVNNGTATIGTNSGGTVYNINMPVTSNNANAEGVANEVIKKLKLEVSKNNKTNKVGL